MPELRKEVQDGFEKRKMAERARAAACLSFDVDAETLWISRNEENLRRPVTLSQGTFG